MDDSTAKGTPSPADSTSDAGSRETGPGSLVAFPRDRGVEGLSHNLPLELSSFVGRQRETAEVKELLKSTQLLTLTGAGGSGKTRLALAVAQDLLEEYEDGVWWVGLASLSDPNLVPEALASALGVHEVPDRSLIEALVEHLKPRKVLVVIDNCEHLVEGCAVLAGTLLRACPELTILATSREPLRIAGEASWVVPSLSLPDCQHLPPTEELGRYESIRLFVERAKAVDSSFTLREKNASGVARLCQKLDGIPLAIELAAARVRVLSVEQILKKLEDPLGLLTRGDRTAAARHRTLRATLQWSYELLSEPERSLFGRLSVFAGGWTLQAAEAVGAGGSIDEGEVLDLLSHLVNKSMVVVVDAPQGSGVRYAMLEPVRQYGQELLVASSDADATRRRHARYYFELAKEVEPWLRGARQQVWLERLHREYSNLRAALEWALESGESELGLWFGGALGEFWYLSGHLSEGRRWLEAALASSTDAPRTSARAKALARAGWIAWEQGDYEPSVALSQRSLALSRELEDEAGALAALSNLGWAALLGNDLRLARELGEEAVALGRAIGDGGGVARALLILGLVAVARGEYERAEALHEESLKLAGEVQDGLAMALSLGMGALASLGRGDERGARALCEEGLRLSGQPRVMNVTAFQLHASAALSSLQGHPERSGRLWGAAESVRQSIGATLSPVEMEVYAPYIEAARTKLEEAQWEEAWAEGKAMSVEEAVHYALKESSEEQEGQLRPRRRRWQPASQESPSSLQQEDVLTRREQEVAALAGGGLTNCQIAEELSISEHTAATHLHRILKKLGLRSRAQLCA